MPCFDRFDLGIVSALEFFTPRMAVDHPFVAPLVRPLHCSPPRGAHYREMILRLQRYPKGPLRASCRPSPWPDFTPPLWPGFAPSLTVAESSTSRFGVDLRIVPGGQTHCRSAAISVQLGSRRKLTSCWLWLKRPTTSRFTRCSVAGRMIEALTLASARSGGSSTDAASGGKKTAHASEQNRPDVLKGRRGLVRRPG